MIRSLYYRKEGNLSTGLDIEDFSQAINDKEGLLWVDFENNPPEADEPILLHAFGFHPLAVDDALQESHVPKLDDWGEYLYIVLHSLQFDRADGQPIKTLELDIFLGANYMVTHHDQSLAPIERVWEACQRDDRYLRNGTDYLLSKLADEVAASYMPIMEEMDDAIDQAEDLIFFRPDGKPLEHIFLLKRAALRLRRIIGPQREVLNKLARDDYRMIDAQARVYFRDVYDHLVRLHDISESIRDLVTSVLETYLSVINNRMNEVMKTLTIITTLFMPLTFLTGFFGMNFFAPAVTLEDWTNRPAFLITLILIVIIPYAMFLWIRRRGWM